MEVVIFLFSSLFQLSLTERDIEVSVDRIDRPQSYPTLSFCCSVSVHRPIRLFHRAGCYVSWPISIMILVYDNGFSNRVFVTLCWLIFLSDGFKFSCFYM